MLERQIQRDIQLRFGALPWMRLWRVNVGVARTPDGGMMRFGLPGMADLSGIVACGRRLEIEVKGPKGRLTEQQEAWGPTAAARCDPRPSSRKRGAAALLRWVAST